VTTNKALGSSAKKDSRPRYVVALEQARAMMGQSGLVAFDRATLLVGVFNDAQWRAKLDNLDDFGLAEILDEYLCDLCLRFHDLRRLLEFYPRRSQWASGKLADMYDEMIEAGIKVPEREAKRTRQTATLAELKALIAEKQDLQQRVKTAENLRGRVEELEMELELARKQIAQLERENVALRARLAENLELLA